MRLIIKDYLMQLKEKDELDYLLCDLLLQKGYVIDSIPKTGNRQYGVDIQAHSRSELLYFVVKQGNIDRRTWDSDPNAVRQSINEILDVHLSLLPHNKKKTIIILATNGIMEENIRNNWEGYVKKQTQSNKDIIITFWSIDEITKQIQKYLFNEYLLPKEIQSSIRKALYFIGERDYKKVFYEHVIDYYFDRVSQINKDAVVAIKNKSIMKALSSLFLASQMIVHYACSAEHYRIGINVNEYLLIKYWKFLLENNLLGSEKFSIWIMKFSKEYEKANYLYYHAIQRYCESESLFPRYGEIVEQRLMIYEIIGYLTSFAYYKLFFYGKQAVVDIVNTVISLISLHPEFQYTPYDSNISQLTMLFRLLCALNREGEVKTLLQNQCIILPSYYRLFHKYPTSSDSYQDALNIERGNEHEEYESSGLWGYLLLWIYLMDDKEIYENTREFLTKDLENVTKCVWFLPPDEEILFYNRNAMVLAGDGVSIQMKENYQNFREEMGFVLSQYENSQFSYEKFSFLPLELIVCRYYEYVPRVIKE